MVHYLLICWCHPHRYNIIYKFIHNVYDNPRKHRLSHHYFWKSIACAWINPGKYSVEEFEVQPEITAPRRKFKLDLSSSWLVSIITQDKAWQRWIITRKATKKICTVDDNNLTPHRYLYLTWKNNWTPSIFSWMEGKVHPS